MLGFAEVALHLFRKSRAVADHPDLHPLADQFRGFVDHALAEKLHQRVDLLRGTPPVFGRERIERQVPDAPACRCAQRCPDRLHTCNMAFVTLLAAQLGPAAVAVHDDGDVLGYAILLAHIRAQI